LRHKKANIFVGFFVAIASIFVAVW